VLPRQLGLAAAALFAAACAIGCAGRSQPVTAEPQLAIEPAGIGGAGAAVADPADRGVGEAGGAAVSDHPVAGVGAPGAVDGAAGGAAASAAAGAAAARDATHGAAASDAIQLAGAASTNSPAAVPGGEPASEIAVAEPAAAAPQSSLRDLCRQPDASGFFEESRRMLEQTFCGATLWFDGLFGGEPDLQNARAVSGRVELSALHSDFHGFDYKGRLRLNYDLPNLERRVRLFLGREEDEEFVADRGEGFAVRSSVFGLEGEEEWLAGLGYSPPGKYSTKLDFRLGGRLKSAPEVFSQVRYRQNVFLGERDVWRFRETVFWENRDGFGSTTSLDWDRVLRRDLILRWSNVGTISEATRGMAWRSALLTYHNLPGRRQEAIAGELFVRGESDADVPLREYGLRAIVRRPLRPYLFGEAIVGYSWPRERTWQERDGSMMVGFGLELLFGRDPW
jgi:hypothetical protein